LHDLTELRKRQLSGIKRQEAMKSLKTIKPSKFRRQMFTASVTDPNTKEMLSKGNITDVQNRAVFSAARKEVIRINKLHISFLKFIRIML